VASDASVGTIALEQSGLGTAVFEPDGTLGSDSEAESSLRSSLDWAICMVRLVSRWLKQHGFASAMVAMAMPNLAGHAVAKGLSLVARLPWKAHLYEFAPTMPLRYPGRPRTKGVRLPSMQQQLEQLCFESGQFHTLRWYGGTHALRQLVTSIAVWDVEGYPPLPLR
jgi:hypothetical protein